MLPLEEELTELIQAGTGNNSSDWFMDLLRATHQRQAVFIVFLFIYSTLFQFQTWF